MLLGHWSHSVKLLRLRGQLAAVGLLHVGRCPRLVALLVRHLEVVTLAKSHGGAVSFGGRLELHRFFFIGLNPHLVLDFRSLVEQGLDVVGVVQLHEVLPGTTRPILLGQGLVARLDRLSLERLVLLERVPARGLWEVGRPVPREVTIANGLDLASKQLIRGRLELRDQILRRSYNLIESLRR